ncbi:MAG TPA: hypothetical protein EYN54_02625 [Methylococcaceae bacterium]|nr:hypothetical protein [Methylococcaceae bacterium]
MKAPLVDQLNRIEKELALLKNKSIPKPVNYKEGIRILEEANKNLNEILSGINKRYELIEQELSSLKSKKPVNYSDDIASLNKELSTLKNKKPLKQNDYSEDIKLLKKDNERLKVRVSELNDKNIELNKNLSALKNKKPIDYSVDISRIDKELTALKSKKPVKQIDYKEDILKLNGRIDPLVKSINEIKNKPVTPLVTEKIKTVDHSKELTKINSEITSIKKSVSNKKDINIKEEIKKTVNQNYINELYRNK